MFNSNERPKLDLPKTKGETLFDIFGFSLYFITILLLILFWPQIPEKVPGHFDASGEVTRWGSKYELIILPALGGLNLLILHLLEKHPQMHNYPKRFNQTNAAQFYLNSRKMLNRLKNMTTFILMLLLFETVSIAMGWWDGLGLWLLPIIFIATGWPIVAGLMERRRIV